MTIQTLIQFQMIADAILLLGMVLFFWYVNRTIKNREPMMNRQDIDEFRLLMDESRKIATDFYEALEEGRKSLKALGFKLDEKERRLKELIEQSDRLLEKDRAPDVTDKPYQDVLSLASQGRTEAEIAALLGLPEGEVKLILNLQARQNED